MDKDIYDITIRLADCNKKYTNMDFKELHFRMIQDEKELQAIIKFALELAKNDIITIKDIIID